MEIAGVFKVNNFQKFSGANFDNILRVEYICKSYVNIGWHIDIVGLKNILITLCC